MSQGEGEGRSEGGGGCRIVKSHQRHPLCIWDKRFVNINYALEVITFRKQIGNYIVFIMMTISTKRCHCLTVTQQHSRLSLTFFFPK